MSFEAGERTVPPDQAYQSALDHCRDLDLEPSFRRAGSAIHSWNCNLHKKGRFQTNGRGKGLGQQSKTSALCEAIEHYLYEIDDRSRDRCHELDLGGLDKPLVGGSPDLELILGNRPATFSRIAFHSMTADGTVLHLPAFLQNPTYSSAFAEENELIGEFGLLRYGTNNGTASGLTVQEALLHAILEVIERDAIGVEMLRVIISKEPAPVRTIRSETLPYGLASLCLRASQEAMAGLRLWNVTSDLGVPVVLAALDGPRRSYFGSGAALSASYALERAVLEAVQGFHVYERLGGAPPLFGRTRFLETSHYQRCYLEAGHFSFRGGSVDVDFADVPNLRPSHLEDVASSLFSLVGSLARNSIPIFQRTLFDGGLVVVQVAAPRLERFHLVTQGIPVAPGARGRTWLK